MINLILMEGLNISYESVIKHQSGRVEHYKTLRNLIVSEIRKSKGLRNNNAKKWWKSVKKIVGTASHKRRLY